jgi:hypothetical protein
MTKAQFARAVGRSKSTISEHLKGPLKAALMSSGRVNAAHSDAVAYARSCGVELAAGGPPPRPRSEYGSPPDVDELLDWTYRAITDRFGSHQGFADFVDVRKVIADTRRLELQNEETDGTTISRELVRKSVFGAIESMFKALLNDAPRTISARVAGQVRSGASAEECERLVRELIATHLRAVKATAVRVLRGQPEPEQKPGTSA